MGTRPSRAPPQRGHSPGRASAPALPSPRTVWQRARATRVPGWCGKAGSRGSGVLERHEGDEALHLSFARSECCGMAELFQKELKIEI
ncbi:hypothetical protein BDA96_03G361000 [Sorghum bicolor]|uniref:Uncharacterized protein n=2 Tax=Sorghum bicolor TaxID=4558 RepID=A0A921RGC6_SORBI|nr:hypothetical protein BDA96_03G361000 [Sorghum bicolor]KXG33603.1 hypothetical protein SORBI_3003G334500 [Sorghum bicolor]